MITPYITRKFPTVFPYTGVSSLLDGMTNKLYYVVLDDQNCYHGILTASDVMEHPKKLVIDCLSEKPKLSATHTIREAYTLMRKTRNFILPVFSSEGIFQGVLSYESILQVSQKNKRFFIRETKKKDKQLSQERDKAQISEKIKEAFIHHVSHEIRTPLNAIQGFTDLICEGISNIMEKEKMIKIVQEQTKNLLTIIDEMIEISQIEAGDIEIKKKDKVFIKHIMSEIQEELTILKNRKGKTDISIICTNELPKWFTLKTDEIRLKQVLSYFVDNAVKYTEHGEIEICCRLKNNNEVEFVIRDTGIGILTDSKDSIFNAFEKIDNKIKTYPGIGLGLTIAKKIIEHLGGNISFTSEENKETIFFVTLPIRDKK